MALSTDVDMDVQSIDMTHIVISRPRKTEDSLFGKIEYEGHNLRVFFYNAQVIKHKQIKHMSNFYTVLFLKLSRKAYKSMVEFDAHCTDQVKTNIPSWFTKGLDENVIEEYYTSSLAMSKTDGVLVKLKVQGAEELLEPGKYDLLMNLKGLRFYKQRFIPEWEIRGVKPIGGDFLNSIESDDDGVWNDDDEIPCPNSDEIVAMYDNLQSIIDERVQKNEQELIQAEQVLAMAQKQHEMLSNELKSLQETLFLTKGSSNALSSLEQIRDVLDEL